MVDALDHGLAVAGDSDRPLSAVGQHLTGHLDTGSSHLTDLLDLAASLPNQTAALAGRDHQSEGDGRPGHSPGGDQIVEVLGPDISQYLTLGDIRGRYFLLLKGNFAV